MNRSISKMSRNLTSLMGQRSRSGRRWAPYSALVVIAMAGTMIPNLNKAAASFGVMRTSNPHRLTEASRHPGHVPNLTTQSVYLGPMPPHELMHMTVAFQIVDPAGVQNAIDDMYNPGSSRFHQWLTPQQFGDQFGRSSDELTEARGWLSAQGFTIDQVWANRLAISFTGEVAGVERAFNVTIGRYRDEQRNLVFYSNNSDPVLPPELSTITEELRGLENGNRYQTDKFNVVRKLSEDEVKRQIRAQARRSSNALIGTPPTFFLGPADLQLAYDITDPATAAPVSNPGKGQVAAIIIDSGLTTSDIIQYREVLGLPPANVKQVTIPGVPTPPQSIDLESALDYGAISCMAPDAEIVFVLAPELSFAQVFAAEQYCVNTLMPTAVNESFGNCEVEAFSSAEQALFQQAVLEGVAFVASAGDDGQQCFSNGFDSGIAMLNCPVCYDTVTAAGGTQYAQPVVAASGVLLGGPDEQVW
ncbi:MAG TPA: protease pro-enzyme activation domain-containing protein, partial [Blastocatellia bacterium]